MKINSKDMTLGLISAIVIFLMFTFRNAKVLYKIRPKTFSEALLEDYDSARVTKPGTVESFSREHRVAIDIVHDVKYYSKSDTLVTIFDTLGSQVGLTQSYDKIRSNEQRQIRNILNSIKQ